MPFIDFFYPEKGENPLVRYSRGFRSLKLIEDVIVWVGILIGSLFLKDLFSFTSFTSIIKD